MNSPCAPDCLSKVTDSASAVPPLRSELTRSGRLFMKKHKEGKEKHKGKGKRC